MVDEITKKIDTKAGIYETEYTLITHRDGSYSVKAPYVKWVNNSGSLAFKKVKIVKFARQIVDAFNGVADITVSEIVFENDK